VSVLILAQQDRRTQYFDCVNASIYVILISIETYLVIEVYCLHFYLKHLDLSIFESYFVVMVVMSCALLLVLRLSVFNIKSKMLNVFSLNRNAI
jgi:hypothetical protein